MTFAEHNKYIFDTINATPVLIIRSPAQLDEAAEKYNVSILDFVGVGMFRYVLAKDYEKYYTTSEKFANEIREYSLTDPQYFKDLCTHHFTHSFSAIRTATDMLSCSGLTVEDLEAEGNEHLKLIFNEAHQLAIKMLNEK